MKLPRAKRLHLIERNAKWWHTPLTTQQKLAYYPAIVSSMTKSIMLRTKKVMYLGQNFYYDNLATPLTLQLYPYEINHNILQNLNQSSIKRALDIGGNIGQFSLTLSHALNDEVEIDVLEPNPAAYDLLLKNVNGHNNIRTFNVGVGEGESATFYYQPGKSGTGSIFKSNTEHTGRAQKIKVDLVHDVKKLTGQQTYDLVKIDVEGYEYSLLQALKPFKTRYLFMEVSLNRYRNFQHSQLLGVLEHKFGKFDILHISGAEAKTNNFDLLLKF